MEARAAFATEIFITLPLEVGKKERVGLPSFFEIFSIIEGDI
jgi:hypothetical protein